MPTVPGPPKRLDDERQLRVLLSKEERLALERKAEELGFSLSSYVRKLIRDDAGLNKKKKP